MLKDTYKATIKKSLTPAATKKLMGGIEKFIDRNSDKIMTLDLSDRFSFGEEDRQILYEACGVTKSQMEDSIRVSKDIYSSNKIHSNPFYCLTILATAQYIENKDEKMAKTLITYMSLNMWTSQHKGMFHYGANRQVMDYTLAHLDNTFLIRQFPSLLAFIQDNTETAFSTYKARIVRCNDKDITWVVDAIWTRIKGKLKKISSKFYENHQAGNYLNTEQDSLDQNNFYEADNVSFAADRLTNKVYIKLINRQYDKRFLKYAISNADTSYQKLANLIEDIIDGDGEDGAMRELIGKMIELYLTQSGKPVEYIAKGDFIAFMKTSFGSNTDAPQMARIKEIIDKWLADNMYKYGKAKYGTTVKIQYRRAIFMFFVFIINYEAKLQ